MRCTLVVKHLTIFHAFYCVWTNFFIWIQRWKKRQTLQTSLCYFSQLVLIFWPGAPKTMREECYTHCIISTRAISINSAFSCYLQIFHCFIGYYSNTIYVDSTGADSSGAENTVSIALFTHSFPRSGPEN